jgi:hypothetical protein
MNKIMIMLLMIFLMTSCKTWIVCKEIETTAFNPAPLCDLHKNRNTGIWRCRCRCFDLNEYKELADNSCGKDFAKGNYPPEKCEGVAGFFDTSWANDIRPKMKELISIRKDYCKR